MEDSPFTLTATSSSGGKVRFDVTKGPAIVTGNKVILTGPGTVTIEASQTGSERYARAREMRSFAVEAH